MTNEAFFGVAVIIYITIVVFATFLMGFREGLITLSICLVSVVVAAILFVTGTIKTQTAVMSNSNNWISWLAVASTLIFLGIVLALSFHRIQKKLFTALNLAKQKSNA